MQLMRKEVIFAGVGGILLLTIIIYMDEKRSKNGYLTQMTKVLKRLTQKAEVLENVSWEAATKHVKHYIEDKYQTEYIRYLRGVYEKTPGCVDPGDEKWTHNFTKPLFSCSSTVPKYTPEERKSLTRRRLKIWCEGTKAYSDYETVPIDGDIFTMNGTESRECLHHYINQNCYDEYPIPNVVHWIRYGSDSIKSLYKLLSLYSVFTIVKPCLVLIHGSHPYKDAYWDVVMPFGENVIFLPREPNRFTAVGTPIGNVANQADIGRLEAIEEFGGIYLDTDVAVFKPLDVLRATKFSAYGVGMSNDLSNAVLFAVKNHDYTKQWLKNWDTYNGRAWTSHSVRYISDVGGHLPHLVQAMGPMFHHFGWRGGQQHMIYGRNCKLFDTFGQHLFHRRSYPNEADVEYIKKKETTFARLSRYILFNDGKLCK